MTDQTQTLDPYDRAMGTLDGLPNGAKSGPSTVRVTTLTSTETWVVTLVRDSEGDETVFLELISASDHFRRVVPPKVVATLLRQHDAVVAKVRSRAAKHAAAERKAQGLKPGFQMTAAERKAAKARKAVA